MDGFASSRNVYVLMEKFDPPTFVDHERHISSANNQWATVGSPAKNVLTFNLIKESAAAHVCTAGHTAREPQLRLQQLGAAGCRGRPTGGG